MTTEQKIELCKQFRNGVITFASGATTITDEQAVAMSSLFPEWEANIKYVEGQIINRKNQLYHVEQDVTALENQPPEMEGMLAVYRPIDVGHEGTLEDPIPFVYGMDAKEGLYYSYEDKIYKCTKDMIPCVWNPGTPGAWWEEVKS